MRNAARILFAFMLLVLIAPAAQAGSGGWVVECNFSHRASDDPIVHPGHPGMAHSHDFFGNRTTNAFSTYSSMVGKATTCRYQPDSGAYWTPTLSKNGTIVVPEDADFYYRSDVDPRTVRAFPADLRIIAGDSRATGPQSLDVVYWNCHSGPDTHHAAVPYNCGTHLIDLHVVFPQCWDGANLDSRDHKSHLAYPTKAGGVFRCPASHPVAIPKVIFRIRWPIHDGKGVRLSSGAPYTAHGDFWNTWIQADMRALTARCFTTPTDCGQLKTKA